MVELLKKQMCPGPLRCKFESGLARMIPSLIEATYLSNFGWKFVEAEHEAKIAELDTTGRKLLSMEEIADNHANEARTYYQLGTIDFTRYRISKKFLTLVLKKGKL